MTDPRPHLRRVLAVPRERRGGRPALRQPAGGALASRWRSRPGVGSVHWCGVRRRPNSVLLHGGGQNAHTWDTVALALDRPLLAVDLPGHGHSDWPQESAWLDPAIDGRRRGARWSSDWRRTPGPWSACRWAAPRRSRSATRHPRPRPPPAPGGHHARGEQRQDVRHRRLPVRARDVRQLRRDPGSDHRVQPDPLGVVAPTGRAPQLGPAARRHLGVAAPDRSTVCRYRTPRRAGRLPVAVGRPRGASRCPCCWPGAAGRRWWTTTTWPSSTAAGPTTR